MSLDFDERFIDISNTSSAVPPLFRKPIYKDWTIWLAGFFVASRSEIIATEQYLAGVAAPDEFLTMSFDTCLALAISGTTFGLFPALLRRRRAIKRGTIAGETVQLATSHFWILMGGIALIANVWAFGNLPTEIESQRKCEMRENAEFCVEVSTLTTTKRLVKISYEFVEPQVISGSRALGFEYMLNLDCLEKQGEVIKISSLGFSGSSLPIATADRQQAVDEILSNDVPPLLRRLC